MRIRALPFLFALLAGCGVPCPRGTVCCDPPGHLPPPGVTPAAHAQPGLRTEPELEGAHPVEFYVQAALARNPEIRARERTVAAQRAQVPQVTALPDPMVSDTFWPIIGNAPQTASGRIENTLMVSQQYPWFGKLSLRGEVAAREADIALAQLGETQLRVVEEVRNSYYEIYFNLQALRITQQSEEFLRRYLRLAQRRYEVGQVSYQDVLLAQVELGRVNEQLIQYRQQLRQSQADLARLLSASPESDLLAQDAPALPPVPAQTEQLFQAALAYRPELQGRLQAILRDQQRVELARLDYYPDVTLGFSWDLMTTNRALAPFADGKDNYGFNVGFNLPIRFRRLGAGVDEARQRAGESARMYDATRDEIFRMIRRLAVQAQALEQQIEVYRKEILKRAEDALDVSLREYGAASGKVDALQVLDNYNQVLRFRVQLARLEAMLGQALASLERAVGAQLAKIAEETAPAPRQQP